MEYFRKLKDWQQMIFMLLVGAFILYFGSWILSPYFQNMDDVNCGINTLIGLACHSRFNP